MSALMMVVDFGDGPTMLGASIIDLADLLRDEQSGAFEGVLHGVYALGMLNTPVLVNYWVTGESDFDENQYAYATVTVQLPNGSKLQAGFTVDGRS